MTKYYCDTCNELQKENNLLSENYAWCNKEMLKMEKQIKQAYNKGLQDALEICKKYEEDVGGCDDAKLIAKAIEEAMEDNDGKYTRSNCKRMGSQRKRA